MDKNEFNQWLTKHQNAYPACAAWMSALPDHRETLKMWVEILANVPLAHANEATMRMIRGIEPLVHYANWHDTPRFVLDHVKAIERDTKPYRTNDTSREPTYRCVECKDTCVIMCYRARDVAQVRSGSFRGVTVGKTARCCLCERAKTRYADMIDKGSLLVFNSFRDIKLPAFGPCCTIASFLGDVERIRAAKVNEMVSIDEWSPN